MLAAVATTGGGMPPAGHMTRAAIARVPASEVAAAEAAAIKAAAAINDAYMERVFDESESETEVEEVLELEEAPRPRRCFTPQEKAELIRQLGDPPYMCMWCGRVVAATLAEVDHIDPFTKGGATTIGNALLMHTACNGKKLDGPLQAGPLHEVLQRLYKAQKAAEEEEAQARECE